MKIYSRIGPAGFGNKLYDAIILLYFKHFHNAEIYALYSLGIHNKKTDPTIAELYPKLTKYITFLPKSKYYSKIRNLKKLEKGNHIILQDISNSLTDDTYVLYGIISFYMFINEIYDKLSEEMKNIFVINDKMLSPEIKKMSKVDYFCIHIRYGDKLMLAAKDDEFDKFIIYRPIYYINLIKIFIEKNIDVYIITDSNKVVEKYIISEINSPNVNLVKLVDAPYWEAFYLLSNAPYMGLSESTFSVAAKLFNKRLEQAIIVYPKLRKVYFTESNHHPGYNSSNNTFHDKLYILKSRYVILNYDTKMVNEMYNYHQRFVK